MSKEWFWRSRNYLGRAQFKLESSTYKRKSFVNGMRSNGRVFGSLAWTAVKKFFWVGVLLFTAEYAEHFIRNNFGYLEVLSEADSTHHLDQLRLYAQLLTAILSIYFATIGIILSAGYTKLRRDVIGLLTSEQVGSFFSNLLVFSTAYCLAVTALPLVGHEPGFLSYVFASFLMLVTMLALFPLGQRLFNFFDLVPLVSGTLLPNISKHIEGAANPKISDSLSNHHSKEAKRLLNQFFYIERQVLADESSLSENLPAMTDNMSSLLMYYLRKKHLIDHGSYWFPRLRKHQQWFFAGDSVTSMALNSSSQLAPDEKPDFDWFETEITSRLKQHIELAFEQQDYELALKLLGRFSSRVSTYSKGFHFDVGMAEISQLSDVIKSGLSVEGFEPTEKQKKLLVGIADTWVALASNLCLETLRRMFTFEAELARFFENDEWSTEAMRELPAFLQRDIAYLGERIEFEKVVEGRRLSQPKYLQQLTVMKLLERYKKILPTVCDFHQQKIAEFARFLHSVNLPYAATQTALASLHMFWKLPGWFENLNQLTERYLEYQHYDEKQYVLPRIDFETMISGFETAREEVVGMLGDPKFVGHIFAYEHDEDLPDHFGQIYFALAEECMDALNSNEPERLEKVVSTFVSLALLASEFRFKDPSLPVNDEFRLHLISTVLVDLTSILGFAIIYGEYFDNKRLSDVAMAAWNSWADKIDDKQKHYTVLLNLTDIQRFSMSASPRDLIRTSWGMAFEQRARRDGFGDRMSYDRHQKHESKIVNEFLMSHSSASQLFLALEILPNIDTTDIEVNYQVEHLGKRLHAAKTEAEVEE